MPHRRDAKRDANEPEIVAALLKVGAGVIRLDLKDTGDLLVGFRGRNYVLEIKNPDGRNRIEANQQRHHAVWPGHIAVVRSSEEALRAIGAVLTW